MAQETVLGRWDLEVWDEEGKFPSWFELREDGTGSFVGRVGSARPIPHVEIHGEGFRFRLPRQYENRTTELEFEGKLSGGRLEGVWLSDRGQRMPWVGSPAPSLERTGETAEGETVELVGDSLAGWHVRWPEYENHWSISEDGLHNAAVGTDLITDAAFEDFRLVAEYRYPQGSNSGIYLRGRYEFQIVDDHGSEPHVGGSGAIYGCVCPKANAILPPGEWNRAEITLRGRTVTVVLNGQAIVENAEIPGITGGALESAEGEPGPILAQGDHGPVTFRRLTLTPLS